MPILILKYVTICCTVGGFVGGIGLITLLTLLALAAK